MGYENNNAQRLRPIFFWQSIIKSHHLKSVNYGWETGQQIFVKNITRIHQCSWNWWNVCRLKVKHFANVNRLACSNLIVWAEQEQITLRKPLVFMFELEKHHLPWYMHPCQWWSMVDAKPQGASALPYKRTTPADNLTEQEERENDIGRGSCRKYRIAVICWTSRQRT